MARGKEPFQNAADLNKKFAQAKNHWPARKDTSQQQQKQAQTVRKLEAAPVLRPTGSMAKMANESDRRVAAEITKAKSQQKQAAKVTPLQKFRQNAQNIEKTKGRSR